MVTESTAGEHGRDAMSPDEEAQQADVARDDAQSTTGAGPSGSFVGRDAGQDAGYAGETGAERRSAAD